MRNIFLILLLLISSTLYAADYDITWEYDLDSSIDSWKVITSSSPMTVGSCETEGTVVSTITYIPNRQTNDYTMVNKYTLSVTSYPLYVRVAGYSGTTYSDCSNELTFTITSSGVTMSPGVKLY